MDLPVRDLLVRDLPVRDLPAKDLPVMDLPYPVAMDLDVNVDLNEAVVVDLLNPVQVALRNTGNILPRLNSTKFAKNIRNIPNGFQQSTPLLIMSMRTTCGSKIHDLCD